MIDIKCTYKGKVYRGQDFWSLYCRQCPHRSEKPSTAQLRFPFIKQMEQEMKAANNRAIEEAIRRQYPMTDEERSWLPDGVRLARFVPLAECDNCGKLSYTDHTVNWRFPGKVCIKDLLKQGFDRSLIDRKFD